MEEVNQYLPELPLEFCKNMYVTGIEMFEIPRNSNERRESRQGFFLFLSLYSLRGVIIFNGKNNYISSKKKKK